MCDAPVVCVDWCDAYAYCEAQGRRLCGRIGGGMTPYDRATDPGQSQWMNGCTAGGQYEWSGGSSPMQSDGEPCWYAGLSNGAPYDVGTHSACQSPSPNYASLSDFSGNVEEWEDSCERTATTGDASDACNTRGGSVASDTPANVRCDALPSIRHARSDVSPTLGFRCCGT
jgi:formylglycine-generating enzyme required for sulfatase activity